MTYSLNEIKSLIKNIIIPYVFYPYVILSLSFLLFDNTFNLKRAETIKSSISKELYKIRVLDESEVTGKSEFCKTRLVNIFIEYKSTLNSVIIIRHYDDEFKKNGWVLHSENNKDGTKIYIYKKSYYQAILSVPGAILKNHSSYSIELRWDRSSLIIPDVIKGEINQ